MRILLLGDAIMHKTLNGTGYRMWLHSLAQDEEKPTVVTLPIRDEDKIQGQKT